jgi:hypothetical protein
MTAPPSRSRRTHLIRGAVLTSVLVALESLPVTPPSEPHTRSEKAPNEVSSPAAPTCPAGTLPDEGVCIPVPPPEAFVAASTAQLALMPGRVEDYGRYLTPISAYPATEADDGQGVLIPAPARTVVTLISLEHQIGSARRIILRGPEPRLLTLHRVTRHAVTRTYVLVYDGLTFDTDAVDAEVPVGTPLGRVSPSRGRAALRLTVRQVRRGTRPDGLPPRRLLSDAVSLACDPRNVLPTKPAPSPSLALPDDALPGDRAN